MRTIYMYSITYSSLSFVFILSVLLLPTKMNRKREVLTLEERVSVIRNADSGSSCRAIAAELGVGKTQVQTIVKDR